MESNNKEMLSLLQEIAQLEGKIAIAKNRTDNLQKEINSVVAQSQIELKELERLTECNRVMESRQAMKREEIQREKDSETFDSFLDMLNEDLKR